MKADEVFAILIKKIRNIQVSGGGISDYMDLSGKPKINDVTLQGNLQSEDIGITIPEELPNPYPITFGGMLLNQTYDGSQAINVEFPYVEILNGTAGTPVGEIISYMGMTAPPNYLICDGTVYNIADYPYLAQHFQDNFGTINFFGGDGTTTFAVPDLRGEFLRGSGTNSRTNQGNGADVGGHQDATEHLRIALIQNTNMIVPNLNITNVINSDSLFNNLNSRLLFNKSASDTISSNISGLYTSRPTNTSVLYCIKYEPTYFLHIPEVKYSYEERRVGTWVDGKPLYEKTVDFGSLPNATTKSVPHGIANVDTVWIHDGYVKMPNGTIIPTSLYNPSDPIDGWYFTIDKTNMICGTGDDRASDSAMITIRYTKTTD